MSSDEAVNEATSLKVSVTDRSGVKKTLAVEVPAERMAERFDAACRKYTKSLKVPGFRQGKVPLHIIKQRFGKEIEQETVESAIEEAMRQAVKEKSLKPLAAPVLKEYAFKKGESLSFTAEFEQFPDVKVKGADGIKVEMKKPVVTDKMVSEALESLRERAARFEPVEGRGLAAGDHGLIDLDLKFEPGKGEDFARQNVMLEIGPGGPHPELAEHLEGAVPGDTRAFTVSYPEDHPGKDFAGRRVDYSVAVREIKTKVLPELDDEFARDLGKFDSMADLRGKVVEDLENNERRKARSEARNTAIEQLIDGNKDIEVPEVLVHDEMERRVEEFARSMVMQGMDPSHAGVDWTEVRERQREPAERSVRAMILLDALANEKKISLESGVLDKALAEEAERRRQTPEALRAKLETEGRLKQLEQQLLRERVLDFIVGEANT